MPFSTRKTALAAAAAFGLLALAACGGGGGGGAPAKTAMEPAPGGGGMMEPEAPAPKPTGPTPPVARTPLTGDLEVKAAIERVFKPVDGGVVAKIFSRYNRGFPAGLFGTVASPERLGDEDDSADETTTDPTTIYEHAFYGALGLPPGRLHHDYTAEDHAERKKIFNELAFNKHDDLGERWTKDGVHMAETNEICYRGAGANDPACVEQTHPDDRYPNHIFSEDSLDSTIGYLDYSAFFLTRYKFIEDVHDGRYLTEKHRLHFELHSQSVGLSPPLGKQAPIATWKGGMIGALGGVGSCGWPGQDDCQPLSALIATEMPALITGDVTLTTKINPSDTDELGIDITFENVASSNERYESWTWEIIEASGYGSDNCPLLPNGCSAEFRTELWEKAEAGEFGSIVNGDPNRDPNDDLLGSFYGPKFEEAGGVFLRILDRDEDGGISKYIHGAFGARRQ